MAKDERLVAWVAIAAILAFAVTAITIALAHNQQIYQTPGQSQAMSYITITATGSVSATPQQAVVSLTANGTAKTAANATAMLSNTLAAMSSVLSGYIMNGTTIQTTSYQLYRPYNSSYYTASEGVTAMLPINRTGAAISALSSISNLFVNGVSIQLSQSQSAGMRSMALILAMQNASTQAQQLVGPATRITISSITVSSAGYPLPGPTFAVAENKVPVFPGQQSVTESVVVKFSYS
ncbi:MAG: SIMPL domain-containing protein [Candidatus Marsarchaeota archaeon]|jgi:uncharacterized protein YggE|nr:SIMPL domain-containing protein [Candidatus Marsarchaeota archaeon]MCL5111925.1 SIMPL domain-containing protein [Candidatus Marsarchaeota archaeon]